MAHKEEGHPRGDRSFPTLGSPGSPTGAARSYESGLPSLTPSSNAQEACAWCHAIIKPGTLPATHGICKPCSEKFQKEAEDVVNNVDTSDDDEPEELLQPRTSEEFASRQTPSGGW